MIIIQARSTSKRFPGKSLVKLQGEPMLHHVISRCAMSGLKFVVAIPEGDELGQWLKDKDYPCYEGSEDNVLERYYKCAKTHGAQHIVRITGDCPLINHRIITAMWNTHINGKYHFTSNCIEDPVNGWEVEIMSFSLLEQMHLSAKTERDREHVTTWVKDRWNKYKQIPCYSYREPYLSKWFPKMSVDTKEDLSRVEKILKEWKNGK